MACVSSLFLLLGDRPLILCCTFITLQAKEGKGKKKKKGHSIKQVGDNDFVAAADYSYDDDFDDFM